MLLSVSLEHHIVFGLILFVLGLISLVVHYKNLLLMLMGGEVMVLGALFILTAFSRFYHAVEGVAAVVVVLALAAAKIAIAISLILLYFQRQKTISFEKAATKE